MASRGKRKRNERVVDGVEVRPPEGSDVRAKLLGMLEGARRPVVWVDDVPGGGYALTGGDAKRPRTIVVGGLHDALARRVYAEGAEVGGDDGPSTREVGKRIHRHVYHLVECIKFRRACTCGSRFLSERTASKAAREVLRVVKAMGLVMVASEVAMVSKEWNLATRADLVCCDVYGRVVLVSLKTGACSMRETERTFRGGLAHVRDTQQMRHHAQLAAELIMMETAGVDVHKAYVVYCRPAGDASGTNVAKLDRRFSCAEGRVELDELLRNVSSK